MLLEYPTYPNPARLAHNLPYTIRDLRVALFAQLKIAKPLITMAQSDQLAMLRCPFIGGIMTKYSTGSTNPDEQDPWLTTLFKTQM